LIEHREPPDTRRVDPRSGQDPETQFHPLYSYAARRGFAITHELADYASGLKEDRNNDRRLFELTRKRAIDVALVWRYDRFARGIQALVNGPCVDFKLRPPDLERSPDLIRPDTLLGYRVPLCFLGHSRS